MSIPPVNSVEAFVTPDDRLSLEGQQMLQEIVKRLNAIADVTAPTGGATVDAEARAAIVALIAAAT